jgi:hypothetical protein
MGTMAGIRSINALILVALAAAGATRSKVPEPGNQVESERRNREGSTRSIGVRLPVIIHGKTLHWLDTGTSFSIISESEARAFGIRIDEDSVSISDPTGGTAKVRTAVADELAIDPR